jgi:hypothetical protein
MVREFKKVGVAAAVAGALLGSSYSHATVQLSEPGDVMLVPYVICNPAAAAGQINTLVGLITFDKERLGLRVGDVNYPAPWSLASLTVSGEPIPTPGEADLPVRRTTVGNYDRTIHWYFYDSRSNHLLDGVIPATDNDFVRFDWCSTIRDTGQTALNGVDGYLIFVADDFDRIDTSVDPVSLSRVPPTALYGHAYQVQGNWASQAFIPVLPNPVLSMIGGSGVNRPLVANVVKRDGYPAFTRLVSGSDFSFIPTASRPLPAQRDVYMRYFLDPALATENRMVFWFNLNSGDYNTDGTSRLGYNSLNGYGTSPLVLTQNRIAAGETYDSEQVYRNSFSLPLPNELNILTSTPSAPRFPGMLHSETERYSGFTVVNSGIIRFGIPEAWLRVATTNASQPTPFVSSGVSFNMLGLGASGNAAQLQTEMSTVGPAY